MSDQVNVGDYSLEISGDEVVVRDESGAIVETVDLDDVQGELTLPDGQKVDLASILADSDVENFQTAAGPANDNLGYINGGSGNFTPFHSTPDEFGGLSSAGALGSTSLRFDALNIEEKRSYDPSEEAPVLVTWSPHAPWSVAENQTDVSFGKIVNGNPADFKFEISDKRFEIIDGILQLRDGVSFDYETESGIELEITATSRTGDKQTLSVHIDVTDVNEAQTDLLIDATAANENVAGAVIGNVSVVDPDSDDDQSYQVSDNRFEIVDGQLKLKDGVSLDHESEPMVDVIVTATDNAGNQISKTFTINAADVNEAPVDIDLSGNTLVENVPGAVIGTLTAIDPDAADSHSFEVSDSRFEVVNGQLKLKDGQSIDFETEPSLDVVVTATDSAGNKVQETFTLSVGGVNEGQTALTLDQLPVSENVAGALVGTLNVADQDAGDTQSFEVSDSRFEVVDGQLKLKDGVSLDRESEPTVNVQVTATDSAGHQISQTFTINVGNVNEAQIAMTLSANSVKENATGAVIGTLKVTDPDAGDKQSFTVSDPRFEVVNNKLQLKPGVSLDFEQGSSIDVDVTATDKGGNQITTTFTITVADMNEAQTALTLDNMSVAENASGAVIGNLTVADQDAGDTQSFKVSDDRFEMVNGQLKLKDGASLDFETEPSVTVKVTATDQGGNSISKDFTVTVQDMNEIAPTVTAKDGAIENHTVNTSTAFNPLGSKAVGDYLYSNNDNAKIPQGGINGVDSKNLTLATSAEVHVTFQKEGAGHHNMLGVYQFDSSGSIIPGSVSFVWLDATANAENKLGASLIKDFLGFSQSGTVSLGTMPAGASLGFFTISNGASDATNKSLLTAAAGGATNQATAMANIASQLSIKVDANGNGHVFVGDKQMNGHTFFTHDKTLNTDFNGSSDINHTLSGVSEKLPGQLLIGFEDLAGGGDQDYNDLVISVNLGSYNVNKLSQSIVQPTVDFSDADSSTLSQAVIQTSGFHTGDVLNVPPSSLFNVTVDHSSTEYTITITGKTGTETLDQYEAFVNSVYFSTTSKVEGERHIDYSVTDNGGLTSATATADLAVSTSYEVSSSQLSNGKTTLGMGDDLLHINTSSTGPIDMGDGHDTVHLAKHGASFGHQEAIKLENIEAIDTTGYGANKVSLSIHDVLNMTDGDNRLTIVGEQGDSVTLTGNGNNHWTVVESNAQFTTYAYSDPSMQAVVEISNQLNAQVS